jgi:MIP family channel proteins
MASRASYDWRRYVAEALGTFALVAIGPGAVMVAAKTGAFGAQGVALAFGLAITIVVAATGHLGGAHINPAVTIGFWTVRRFPGRDVVPYVVAQCLGAIGASAALAWILGPVGNFGATVPALSVGRSFAVEAAYSGLLAFVIMAVATDERTPSSVAPFAIGATVFAGALVTGPLTGGSFNPARSLGPAVIGGVWTAHWLYWAAPIGGMIVAMRVYELLRGTSAPSLAQDGAFGVEGPIDRTSAKLEGVALRDQSQTS